MPLRPTESETLQLGPAVCVLTNPPEVCNTSWSLRVTVLV